MGGCEREGTLPEAPVEPRARRQCLAGQHPPQAGEDAADSAVHENVARPCGVALPRSRVVGYALLEVQLAGVHPMRASRAREGRQCHTKSKHRAIGGDARLEGGLEGRGECPAGYR